MKHVKVMGIVNVTPDSFSDGGKFFTAEEAIRRARNLAAEGAEIIDLGGESTRPGATPLDWSEEWARIEPVLTALRSTLGLKPLTPDPQPLISVDTYHPETAERAIAAGADMINCVKVETSEAMLRLAAGAGREIQLVLPAKAYDLCHSSFSILHSPFYLDPMIGFGTTREEDIELLRSIPELAKRGPVLVGASRKRIVKRLVGEKTPGKDLAGNLAIAVWAAMNGAEAIRVHDVRETVQALRVIGALEGET